MTREEAESVKDALRAIYEQCKTSSSCENCPIYDYLVCPVYDCCDDLFACIHNR